MIGTGDDGEGSLPGIMVDDVNGVLFGIVHCIVGFGELGRRGWMPLPPAICIEFKNGGLPRGV